jgi:uncharacterized membrane protein YfcA
VIVPMLALLFHTDIRYAIGASLISTIATSSGAAAAYVREGFSNVRIGMFLEIATTVGAVVGAGLASKLSTGILALVFGVVLLYSAIASIRNRQVETAPVRDDRIAAKLKMVGVYPSTGGPVTYRAHRVFWGFGVMFGAGTLSGLLGIGSGAVKVLAMDQIMGIPFKVSTATSNFMIGVTAAASAGIYLRRGYIDPVLSMPVVLGVLAGSFLGTGVLYRARTRSLRLVFGIVIFVLGIEMIFNGLTGRL